MYPALFQRVLTLVKPARDQNKRQTRKDNWWLYGENAPRLRKALGNLSRYIGTPDTSKHKPFIFIPAGTLPDVGVYAVPSDDALVLGVLSSVVHQGWLGVVSPRLEDRPRWKPAIVFDPFPFPALDEFPLKQRIRDLGERLDAHRKRQQELHPDLTLTGIYNVLEKLRSGEPLTAKDKLIHDQGLVTLLKQLHDDLDTAVLEAYGWQSLASSAAPVAEILARGGPAAEALEQELLTRLVALNHDRAAEEKRGLIRWLRPDYQAPGAGTAQQTEIGLTEDDDAPPEAAVPVILDWPAELPAQVAALRKLLPSVGQDHDTLAACFGRKNKKRTDQITAILATLKDLGHIA
jgi:hypothetical protein